MSAFLSAALKNVRSSAPIAPGQAQVDATTAYEAFTNLLAVHTELHRLYSAAGGDGGYKNAFLNGLVLATARQVVLISGVVS